MTKSHLFKTILFMATALLLAGGAQALNLGADGGNLAWNVDVANDGMQLKVSGPDGFVWEHTYEAGEAPSFSIFDKNGYVFPEGQYTWELIIVPSLDDATRKAMIEARDSGDQVALAQLEKSLGQRTHSGTFRIEAGSVMLPTDTSERLEKDQVFLDDVIVDGSLCVGFDCVNGENFGFDTIRLKENNLRIHFDDTSSSGSFPSNDWRLTANDSANGGLSRFTVEDATAGRNVFTIEAAARSNSLYVDSSGRVGVGTSNPVLELHVSDGDSPALRLEQNGSSGFTAQTWDIAGNETNFFVRDVTNGSRLPFRIQPGAPTSSIYIASSGNVGMGTTAPSSAMHVKRSDGTAKIFVEETNGTAGDRTLLTLENNGGVSLVLTDTTNQTWEIKGKAGLQFSRAGSGQTEMVMSTTGDLTIAGTLTENSSVHAKENFRGIDGQSVLARVLELPISTWNYRKDPATIRHMGPMAQDFFAAFGLGHTVEGIAPRNLSAVALAAIQGLNQKLEAKTAEVESLQERLAMLEKRLGLE